MKATFSFYWRERRGSVTHSVCLLNSARLPPCLIKQSAPFVKNCSTGAFFILRLTTYGRSFGSFFPQQKRPLFSDLFLLAGATRLELATSAVTGQRSNQLNYTPVEQLVLYMIKIQIASLFLKKLHFFYFMWKIAL